MRNSADTLSNDGSTTFSPDMVVSALRKRKWMILGIAVAVPLLVGFVVSKQPRLYQAKATLVIDPSVPQYLGSNFRDVVDVGSDWWTSQETMQTELRVLASHSQAVGVAKALCAKTLGRGAQTAMSRLLPATRCDDAASVEAAALSIQGLVQAEPVKDSRVVMLAATSNDAELAALIANTDAQVYIEHNLEHRLSQSEGASEWLGDEYGNLTQQLNEAEHALIEFKRQNNVLAVGLEDQQNDLSSRHKKLADELNNVQVKLIELSAQRAQYAKLSSNDPLNDVTPGVSDTPLMMKLKELYGEQYAKLVELKGKYLDQHPAVIAQQARVEAIKADLKREAELAGKNVEARYSSLVKQEKDLTVALDNTTKSALQLEQRAIEYNRFKRNYDRLAKLSDQVGGRERETSLAGHLKTNNARVLDAALVPSAAISPNVGHAAGIAFALSLLLGIGLAFLLETLDSTVKSQEDVEKIQGLPFLGLVPSIPTGDTSFEVPPPPALSDIIREGSKDLFVLTHPKSAVAECCRAIRTNLLFMSPDRPTKTLLITSGSPREGKTTTAVNLAITLAQSGLRVLLVDTDMRRPRLHKAFGIPSTPEGLSKAIVGESHVLEMVRETGVPNLSLLPCGAIPPNPAELLHAERFKRLVGELAQHYDRVIFDSPPVSAVTDAAILSRLTDGTLLVAQCGVTTKEMLARACRNLADSHVNLLGCVLNDLDLNKQNSYGYRYYYSHYGYHPTDGDGGEPPPRDRAVNEAGG
jgi:polysaccharide biosynthesis transport protein